jgi:hypothetical protein
MPGEYFQSDLTAVPTFGSSTGEYDWIPKRAIGPTDAALYLRIGETLET